MKFQVIHDRVVIRRAESDTKSKGGIIIPDNAKESRRKAKSSPSPVRDESGALIAPTSRPATSSCSANGPEPRSSSTARPP